MTWLVISTLTFLAFWFIYVVGDTIYWRGYMKGMDRGSQVVREEIKKSFAEIDGRREKP